jgi:head-tail adaptor
MQIQQRSVVQDSAGEQSTVWNVIHVCWGHREPQIGKEFVTGEARAAGMVTKFTLRYFAGLTPAMRIRSISSGQIYNITSVAQIRGVKHELVIFAEELVGDTN